ncbi:MAG: succinate dehydrogenase [Chitinispirillia bacterium]
MDNDNSLLFWLKKLQSLIGIIPVGVFLFIHFSINSYAEKGAEAYTKSILFIRSLPLLFFLEVGGIFIPIILHALIGLLIIITVKFNMLKFPYWANFSFSFQRITGLFLFLFIGYHVWHMKFSHPADEMLTARIVYSKMSENIIITIFYLIGTIAAAYHLINGLYNFAVKWGITYGQKARKYWAWTCFILGLIFTGWGVHIWWMVFTKIG